jgi:hypothetical protein
MRLSVSPLLCALALLTCAAVSSRGAIVTFSGLHGENMDPFNSTYSEAGFDVTPTLGEWNEAHLYGNPTPDIFGLSDSAAVEVTAEDHSAFTFTSVDLADAGDGGASYELQGLLNGVTVFDTGQTGSLPEFFEKISSPNPSDSIDLLRITMFKAEATYNIDNIVLNNEAPPAAVPLPPAQFTGFPALLGMVALAWGRTRHAFCSI